MSLDSLKKKGFQELEIEDNLEAIGGCYEGSGYTCTCPFGGYYPNCNNGIVDCHCWP